jgi:hypothetical protein
LDFNDELMAFDWITREHKNHEFIENSLKKLYNRENQSAVAGSNYFMGFCVA